MSESVQCRFLVELSIPATLVKSWDKEDFLTVYRNHKDEYPISACFTEEGNYLRGNFPVGVVINERTATMTFKESVTPGDELYVVAYNELSINTGSGYGTVVSCREITNVIQDQYFTLDVPAGMKLSDFTTFKIFEDKADFFDNPVCVSELLSVAEVAGEDHHALHCPMLKFRPRKQLKGQRLIALFYTPEVGFQTSMKVRYANADDHLKPQLELPPITRTDHRYIPDGEFGIWKLQREVLRAAEPSEAWVVATTQERAIALAFTRFKEIWLPDKWSITLIGNSYIHQEGMLSLNYS